jgi:hypothetical protein
MKHESMSPIDQEIVNATATSTSVALITGEIPPQFVGSREFRAYVIQDGRACADRLWFVNPDGTGANLPLGRELIRNEGRNHSAYCRITEDRSAVRVIIPAVDVWTAPVVIYAKVATEQAKAIRACYE